MPSHTDTQLVTAMTDDEILEEERAIRSLVERLEQEIRGFKTNWTELVLAVYDRKYGLKPGDRVAVGSGGWSYAHQGKTFVFDGYLMPGYTSHDTLRRAVEGVYRPGVRAHLVRKDGSVSSKLTSLWSWTKVETTG